MKSRSDATREQTNRTRQRLDTVSRILGLATHHDFALLIAEVRPKRDPLQQLLDMVDEGQTDPYKVGMLLGEIRQARRLDSLAERLRKELAERQSQLPSTSKEKS